MLCVPFPNARSRRRVRKVNKVNVANLQCYWRFTCTPLLICVKKDLVDSCALNYEGTLVRLFGSGLSNEEIWDIQSLSYSAPDVILNVTDVILSYWIYKA